MTMPKSLLFLPLLSLLSAPISLLAAAVYSHWFQLSLSVQVYLVQPLQPPSKLPNGAVFSSWLPLSLSSAAGRGDFLLILPAAVGLFRPWPPQLTVPSSPSQLSLMAAFFSF
ncbi:hypothetical protein ACOSP7_026797 [Xanthoceras sorbifolium]